MTRKIQWIRFLLVVALILATSAFLRSRNTVETIAPAQDISSFPLELGNWKGRDVVIPQWALNVLGDGTFVERSFSRNPHEPPVDFFLAYFPTQRTGSSIHSPQNCLPGSGWTPVDISRINLPIGGSGGIRVNRYVIEKDLNRQLVLYWYQEHGRVVASEYWSKFYLVLDSIRLNRSDAALVRFITPLTQDETVEAAEQREIGLIQSIYPILREFVPQ